MAESRNNLKEECNEALSSSRGTILDISGAAPESADLSSYRCRRKRLCLWSAALRAGNRGDQTTAVQTAGRDRARPDEAMCGGRWVVLGPCRQVQRLLHCRRHAFRGV